MVSHQEPRELLSMHSLLVNLWRLYLYECTEVYGVGSSSSLRSGRKTMNIRRYMELAAQVSRLKDDDRVFRHGGVGLRKDGVLVCAQNGCPKEPDPRHHCEYRLSRKLGHSGVVFLVRTLAD